MFVNSSTDLTPKKQQPIIFTDQKKLEESLKKTSQSELNLKNRIQKMSYKMLSDCIFEIAINQPSSQPIIENYLNEQYIRDQSLPLKSLTQDFLQNKNSLEEEQKKLIQMIPQHQLQITEDLNQLQQFVQESNSLNIKDCLENLQNQTFKGIIEQLDFFVSNIVKQKVDKKTFQLQKQNERLEQKIEIREKNLKMNKHHLKEYLTEIEKMREKIISLEFTNQELRNNFDNTIQNIEQKVDQQNQKKYGNQLNDFKNKLLEKEKKINEIFTQNEQRGIQETQEQNMKRNFQRQIKDFNSQIELKDLKIQSLQQQINDTENLMNIEKQNFEQQQVLLQQLKQENENLNSKIVNLSYQNQNIQIEEMQNLQQQINSFQHENSLLLKKQTQIRFDLNNLQKLYIDSQNKCEDLNQEIQQQKSIIDILNIDLKQNQQKCQQNEFKQELVLEENNKLAQQIEQLNNQNQQNQNIINQKQEDLQIIYNKCKKYQKDLDQSKIQNELLQQNTHKYQKEYEQISLLLKEQQHSQNILLEEQKKLLQKIDQNKLDDQENKQIINNLKQVLQTTQQESQLKDRQINDLQDQYQKKTEEQSQKYIQLKKVLQENQEQKKLTEQDKLNQKQTYEKQIEIYENRIQQLQCQIDQNKDQNIAQIKKISTDLNLQISQQQDLIQSFKQNQLEQSSNSQKQQKELDLQYNQSLQQIKTLKYENNKQQKQIIDLQKKEKKYINLQKNLNVLKKQLQCCNAQEKKLRKEFDFRLKKIKKVKQSLLQKNQSKNIYIKALHKENQDNTNYNKRLTIKNQQFLDQLKNLMVDFVPKDENTLGNTQEIIINDLKKLTNKIQKRQSQQNTSTNFFSVQMRILKQEEILQKFEQTLHQKLNSIIKLIQNDYENYTWKQKMSIIKRHLKKNMNQVQQWYQWIL